MSQSKKQYIYLKKYLSGSAFVQGSEFIPYHQHHTQNPYCRSEDAWYHGSSKCFLKIYVMCMCFPPAYYVCTTQVPGAHGGEKKEEDIWSSETCVAEGWEPLWRCPEPNTSPLSSLQSQSYLTNQLKLGAHLLLIFEILSKSRYYLWYNTW